MNVLDETYELRSSSLNHTENGGTSVDKGISATPTSRNGATGPASFRGSVRKAPPVEIVALF
eukprot:scaffold1168_cov167-Amphora_coffeaeformis.AAC.3